ncbi:MAG: MobF family relaxase [Planctomycetota bacterium]
MFRVFQSKQISDAKGYYTRALAKEDYYTKDRQIQSHWKGEAAKLLGLDGPVTTETFASLCDNLHPVTGDKVTARHRTDRTVGYDFNFHCPKGLSLLQALGNDGRITQAVRDAVDETMLEIERDMHTRVRKPGPDGKPRDEDRRTGNMIWADFTHFTTRPVDGVPDPHLHVHCFAFNATRDPEEDQWKAGQFRQHKRDAPYYEAALHTRLAAKIEDLGYPIMRRPGAQRAMGWDLEGISEELIRKYSNRTAEIEKTAQKLKITDPAEIAELGARTRSAKADNLSAEDLARTWDSRLTDAEREQLFAMAQAAEARTPPARDTPELVAAAVDHALEHVFARASVESDRRVIAEALAHSVGRVSPEAIAEELKSRENVFTREAEGQTWVTTREVLEQEARVLSFAVEGKGTLVPMGLGYDGRDGERYEIGTRARMDGLDLTGAQRYAVEHVLSSSDRVTIIRGGAGTGKTTLMRETAQGLKHAGVDIIACSVTSDASRKVLRDAGFTDANTLKHVLGSPDLHVKLKVKGANALIWIDEAGLVGTPTMHELFQLAERTGARVLLTGDIRQHAPVERGDAMGLLERQAGITPAEVDQVVRQKGLYKEAVEAFGRGELTRSVEILDRMGAIKEMDAGDTREHLADRYAETVERGKSCLVVSPTHAEGAEVTDAIRDKLKASGRIKEDTVTLTRLQDKQWTDAEKRDVNNYQVGQVVEYAKSVPGNNRYNIERAPAKLRATVIAVDQKTGQITTEDAAKLRRPLQINQPDTFDVFEKKELKLAAGDEIRFTKNGNTIDKKHRIYNGNHYRVAGFVNDGPKDATRIVLENGWKVGLHYGHLNHGVCITPQASQGSSASVVLGAMSAESTTASTTNQLNVILSRGKDGVEIVTDSRKALMDAIAREQKTRSATELMKASGKITPSPSLEHAREVQRLRAHERTRQEIAKAAQRSGSREQSKSRSQDRRRDQDRGGFGREIER